MHAILDIVVTRFDQLHAHPGELPWGRPAVRDFPTTALARQVSSCMHHKASLQHADSSHWKNCVHACNNAGHAWRVCAAAGARFQQAPTQRSSGRESLSGTPTLAPSSPETMTACSVGVLPTAAMYMICIFRSLTICPCTLLGTAVMTTMIQRCVQATIASSLHTCPALDVKSHACTPCQAW